MQSVLDRTNRKIKQNLQISQHQWTFEFNAQKDCYIVLPGVFSPAIFLGTQWLTIQVLNTIPPNSKFLEIGGGCGVTSIQLARHDPTVKVSCCDINPQSVKNTQLNAQRFKVSIEIKESDMFSAFPQRRFDVIYWNYPFHNVDFSTGTMLQKAIRDPNYKMLDSYLKEASSHLQPKGYLLFGFSQKMGDLPRLTQLSNIYHFQTQVLATNKENSAIILVKLTPI